MKIRTLIVDDELLGRRLIRRLLASEISFEVIGECIDGEAAVTAISRDKPDLVFLDIQMPGLDGFEVLQNLPEGFMPIVVFVTAHDTFAVKAFEAHGLDYILKPFDEDRFYSSLRRVEKHFSGTHPIPLKGQVAEMLKELRPVSPFIKRLVVKGSNGLVFLKTADIDWIGSEGNYLKLKVGRASYLIRGSIAALEKRLDPDLFVRLHRSTIANIDRITELKPTFKGDATVVMSDGSHLSASRKYRKLLQKALGGEL